MQKNSGLFKNPTKVASNPSHARLEKIKELTRQYIESNNGLVELLWDLELAIFSEENQARKEIWQSLYNELQEKHTASGAKEKITALLHTIEALEVELKGGSTIGRSPYRL
ncbi:hypothetical protein [Legionella impletisoli]|uniref:Uncharacterized protein n=1 Tax=Legionella impletisoli TaxID=343510 RepID=A0A917JPP1_9GAMM|nr:hypothetical protein [Legionella impletisoli]GGI77299.1 hypothetical protein GCM10007966_02500 [Legionella impletisoli]